MDPLMSPFSMGTTPLHLPDEDLANFSQTPNPSQVYHHPAQMIHPQIPQKQMQQQHHHTYAPNLMSMHSQPPQTPVHKKPMHKI